MSILVIANIKGGTGKSTITLNLIHHIKPDLIIDADSHKGISNLLNLGKNKKEVRHAVNKQQIIEWTKDESKTIIIDCGGFDSDVTRYAISQSDFILCPTTDDPTDQFALIEFNKILEEVSLMVGEHLTAQILLNRIHHSRRDFDDLDILIDSLKFMKRLDYLIPQSALIPKSAFKGEAVKKGKIYDKFNELAKHIKQT